MKSTSYPATALATALVLGMAAMGAAAEESYDFASLTLEELGSLRITSVSKKPERLAGAAASVFVLTREDIRRGGATSLPEALRLAPNLYVAARSAHGHTITARGFNSSLANKLLVLIDGRSVYTPFFAGVFWDVQDLMLEDVERIEVISGPGGTLWGTNAVNGVINIITRSARDTRGTLLSAGAGQRGVDAGARHGAAFGADGAYRLYAKYTNDNHTELQSGAPADDAGRGARAGFRADWGQPAGLWSAQGNVYHGHEGQPLPGTIAVAGRSFPLGVISLSGANLLTRWSRENADGSSLSAKVYLDHTKRVVPPTFSDRLTILDVEVQHALPRYGAHNVVWGANYRIGNEVVANSVYIAFLPARLKQHWSSLFIQDEIALLPELRLTAGARVEHNDYTGREFLPNARLAWTVTPRHTLWTALSRAVRAPSRLDVDTYIPGAPPYVLAGGPRVRSEIATVAELGYRGQPLPRLSLSATLFHADYDHLRSQELGPTRRFVVFDSLLEGRMRGIETWGGFQASPRWRLSAGWTAQHKRLTPKPGSTDTSSAAALGQDPSHQGLLRSSWDLTASTELDVTVRRVGAVRSPVVPSYTVADVRLGWRPRPGWEVSAGAHNIGKAHTELGGATTSTAFTRGVYARLVVRY
ncbi:TonB-dependent receptor plug domain-containing protein [Pseudoduganella namucuonensis]|uniref:Iron complex outermembrane recepter protein n=1 Tax=Pseudoduganella namucuonensis TaxID=1035707 RepID=A0A1I7FI22_9BURK|nr:TonB-dependent receptor [Pseudoduganella namucuonensis]SFU35837.1 iron complex outermembrane recepter protein [Pseudoduganella namucuonensis]